MGLNIGALMIRIGPRFLLKGSIRVPLNGSIKV